MAGFGKVGLIADLGLPFTLPARIGRAARGRSSSTARSRRAEAERIGLVDQVVPKGGALEAAMEKARFLAAQAPLPIALTKQILAEGLDRALEDERHLPDRMLPQRRPCRGQGGVPREARAGFRPALTRGRVARKLPRQPGETA